MLHISILEQKILTKKNSVTPKVWIIYQKHLFKLIPKSISKFPKV